ncbi:hypothetical protein SAMN04487886_10773 [Clostridium sp. DSM 8431]|uniref:plasmid mobilization protein n=1 Tax=Clostridium sp. DSM 8431 TaxID=1761781 RepID=UPI0008E6357C|nr:plasmid mobilization relaxosome protein MobC [Clostridium sp. DSM 8431]SFU61888.1 hypothetical protein SAMN04487886_10773 [Clostridium sp. DSM 8431]
MEKRTRPKQIKFWATEEELKEINKRVKESKLTKQEYLLRSSLNKKITVIPGLKEILLELSKEGNNLSNFYRQLKINGQADAEKILEMQEKLNNLWDLIDETLKEGRGDE